MYSPSHLFCVQPPGCTKWVAPAVRSHGWPVLQVSPGDALALLGGSASACTAPSSSPTLLRSVLEEEARREAGRQAPLWAVLRYLPYAPAPMLLLVRPEALQAARVQPGAGWVPAPTVLDADPHRGMWADIVVRSVRRYNPPLPGAELAPDDEVCVVEPVAPAGTPLAAVSPSDTPLVDLILSPGGDPGDCLEYQPPPHCQAGLGDASPGHSGSGSGGGSRSRSGGGRSPPPPPSSQRELGNLVLARIAARWVAEAAAARAAEAPPTRASPSGGPWRDSLIWLSVVAKGELDESRGESAWRKAPQGAGERLGWAGREVIDLCSEDES